MPVPILGIPFDANSSYLRGAAQAPPQIREALFSQSSNLYSEMGIDLGASESLFDAGDLQLGRTPSEDFAAIESGADELLQRGTPVIFPFCGKSQEEVAKLVSNPSGRPCRAYICNECIEVCHTTIKEEAGTNPEELEA